MVLIESGLHLAPDLALARDKTWRGVRAEVPWIDRVAAEIVREHVRFTRCSPSMHRGPSRRYLSRTLEHIGLGPVAAVLDRLSPLAI